MYGYAGGWWMFLMPLLSLGLLALIVWAVIRLVQGPHNTTHQRMSDPSPPGPATGRGGPGAPPSAETAREILDRRLATGEIDIETYRATRAELDASPTKRER